MTWRGETRNIGTFTVVAVSPDLIACVLATGTEWKMTAQGVEE